MFLLWILGTLGALYGIDHAALPDPWKVVLGILVVLTWPLAALLLG